MIAPKRFIVTNLVYTALYCKTLVDKPAPLYYLHAMHHSTATSYFWFFGYPKPLAAEGMRLV